MMTQPFRIISPERAEELESFFKAVREGDLEAVRASAEKDGTLIGAYAPNQWCCREIPLGVAVSSGDVAMVDLLLDLGADPNQKTAWWAGGFAPLHIVSADRADLIELLIERGAVVDVHAAAALSRVDDLVALLDHDPFLVNMPGGDGGRPLHFAADPVIAGLLLDRGALVDPLDVDHGSTPAQWAVRDRQEVTRALLEQGARGDVFMFAALDDIDRLAELLGEYPEDATRVLSPDDFPSPGSHGGHIYQYLLTGYGSPVLHVAAKFGSVRAIDLLQSNGAQVSVRGGYDDQTTLHAAASNNRVEAIRRLVALGADLDAESGPEHGTPPLVWAIVFGARDAVRVLLELGAVVTPGVVDAAAAGVAGEFRQMAKVSPETWVEIQGMVT